MTKEEFEKLLHKEGKTREEELKILRAIKERLRQNKIDFLDCYLIEYLRGITKPEELYYFFCCFCDKPVIFSSSSPLSVLARKIKIAYYKQLKRERKYQSKIVSWETLSPSALMEDESKIWNVVES